MLHEQRILEAVKSDKIAKAGAEEAFKSFMCLLEIQEKSEGYLKVLANSFLRPFMGSGQIAGVPLDQRYATVSRLLKRLTELNKDPVHTSLLEAHARGEWGLYKLFCEQGSVEYCSEFLPDEKLIGKMNSMTGASSMILLKVAYLKLRGPQQNKVAERLRNLYRTIGNEDQLKRRVIEDIYRELFSAPMPVGMLS